MTPRARRRARLAATLTTAGGAAALILDLASVIDLGGSNFPAAAAVAFGVGVLLTLRPSRVGRP